VYEISREPLNRSASNSQGRRVWSFVHMSLNVKVKCQGHQEKNSIFWPLWRSACGLCLVRHLKHLDYICIANIDSEPNLDMKSVDTDSMDSTKLLFATSHLADDVNIRCCKLSYKAIRNSKSRLLRCQMNHMLKQ